MNRHEFDFRFRNFSDEFFAEQFFYGGFNEVYAKITVKSSDVEVSFNLTMEQYDKLFPDKTGLDFDYENL